jgi:hypothetical protein
MTFTRADLLATAERSPAAAGAGDRKAWIGLFTSNGCVEDPVGSAPHRGVAAIGQFYDTFIGPRDIRFHPDVDIVVGQTVVRDGELEVTMASTLTLRVPVFIRYDLEDEAGELKIAALWAFWELPAMVAQYLRGGIRAVPAGVRLSRLLMRPVWSELGLSADCAVWAAVLGGCRRFLTQRAQGTRSACGDGLRKGPHLGGDGLQMSAADLLRHLSGARWRKLIGSGYADVAAIERAGQRSVFFAEVGSEPVAITGIQLFRDAG